MRLREFFHRDGSEERIDYRKVERTKRVLNAEEVKVVDVGRLNLVEFEIAFGIPKRKAPFSRFYNPIRSIAHLF